VGPTITKDSNGRSKENRNKGVETRPEGKTLTQKILLLCDQPPYDVPRSAACQRPGIAQLYDPAEAGVPIATKKNSACYTMHFHNASKVRKSPTSFPQDSRFLKPP